MSYNVILIEADGAESLGNSCLNDLRNFLNYCRLSIGCNNINMVYVLTHMELSNLQKSKFLVPTKKTSLTFINFTSSKNIINVVEFFKKQDNPMIIYISGHGGQILDRSGDEKDGLDEYIPLVNNQIMTDDDLTKLIVDQEHTVICIVDTCHSGSMVDFNYKYDGDEFFQNRNYPIPESRAFYIGACEDDQYAYCTTGKKIDSGGALTIKIIEQQLLNDFLKDPCIKNITKAYDGLEYFLRFHNQKPSIQTNFLED